MPSMSSKLPTLSLLGNLSQSMIGSDGYPKERQINRSILLDTSPDREELLSNNSIEDIRERLKLCVHRTDSHWLYRTKDLLDDQQLPGDTTTTDSLLARLYDKEDATERKLASRSQTPSSSSANSGTVKVEQDSQNAANAPKNIWSSRSLSTLDRLISPRPLGPTHTLVVSQCHQNHQPDADSRADDTLEIPINDLLFILNVPNLRTSRRTGRLTSVLPRRLHKEMPRVALHVPSLDTFPDVVAYLHTKDKDTLFRQLIPKWIRDIIHPLEFAASPGPRASALLPLDNATIRVYSEDVEHLDSQCLSFLGLGLGLDVASIAKGSVKRLLSPLSPIVALANQLSAVKPASATGVVAVTFVDNSPKIQNDERRKAIPNLAKKVADTHKVIGLEPDTDFEDLSTNDHSSDHGIEVNVLRLTADRLDALAANFTYLGYFERAMWLELDIYRDVLAEALKSIPQ